MNNKVLRVFTGIALISVLAACGGSGSGSMFGGIEGSGSPMTSAGAVTALGSVFVNGVKYDLTGAAITVDGELAREEDLAVGSIVVVEGTVNADGVTGRATRVTAGIAVSGPITSIDVVNERFTVLGQRVELDLGTVIEDANDELPLRGLMAGRDVEVSGFVDSSGTIRARLIARRDSEKPLQVTGSVTGLDSSNRTFSVNGTVVNYSSATMLGFGSAPLEGAAVRVTARTFDTSGALLAEQVSYRNGRLPGDVGDAAAVQGWVTRYGSATDFDVNGYRVVVTPGTTITGTVGLDAFVAVKGEIIAQGAVQVSQLTKTAPFTMIVKNAIGEPLAGALVTISGDGVEQQATTDAEGVAAFAAAPAGDLMVSINAPGFITYTFAAGITLGPRNVSVRLSPETGWLVGRAIVLGTRMLERTSDGRTMTFSIDVAVVNEHSEAVETFTSADFSLWTQGCDWNGPRGCASDANGNWTGNLYVAGPASGFGLQPPAARQPYRARVLAVRYGEGAYGAAAWDLMAPALRSFFGEVSGNDTVSLSSVQIENGSTTYQVHGPFTADGTEYFDKITELAEPGGGEPAILQALSESIMSAAMVSGATANVLVIAPPMMSIQEFQVANDLAQSLGVRVSSIDFGTYGVPEMAPRTGGFTVEIGDRNQIPVVVGVVDRLLAGTLPFYRMEFELTSERPGAFIEGGNVKATLAVRIPNLPLYVYAPIDVAVR